MGVTTFIQTNTKATLADGPSADAFNRLRVSNPVTLFDSKQLYDAAPLFWDDAETSGGGTSTSHSTATAATTISVSNTTAGTRIRQTKQRFNYSPGKSQLIFLTGILGGSGSGITRRIGYYDANNGVFFNNEGGTINVTVRTSTSGSPVDTDYAQSTWNLDKFDGTGPSGITLDFTKAQIMVIDLQWLGVGRIRWGFAVSGILYYAHEADGSNKATTVYMSTPNLPLRYEISNDGTGGAASLVHICSTVISEGGKEDIGILRYKSTAGTHVDANTENTLYAILGIRLKSTALSATIKLVDVSIAEHQGSKNFEWVLLLNPTVAGSFTYADETNSAVQTATGATANTVSGGTPVGGGLASSAFRGGPTVAQEVESALTIGSKIDGTADELVVCVRPIGGSTNIDIEGSLTWRELT